MSEPMLFSTDEEKILFLETNFASRQAFYAYRTGLLLKSRRAEKAIKYSPHISGAVLTIFGSIVNKFSDSIKVVSGISWAQIAIGAAVVLIGAICKVLIDNYISDAAALEPLIEIVDRGNLNWRGAEKKNDRSRFFGPQRPSLKPAGAAAFAAGDSGSSAGSECYSSEYYV